MSSMIERVARAIADSANVSADGTYRTDVHMVTQPWHRNAAPAAIEAMEKPTPEMVQAGQGWDGIAAIWKRMINVAKSDA